MAKSLAERLAKNKYVEEHAYDPDKKLEYISTGCVPMNILFSGRPDGGIVRGTMMTIAADSSLGKSFVGLMAAANAQKKGMTVFFVDTEKAYNPEFAKKLGIDLDNFVPVQSKKIEKVQQIIVQSIGALEPEEQKDVFLVIDSWGGLLTSKTSQDAADGKDVVDMTIAKKKNSLANLIAGLDCTKFVINAVYDTMSAYNPQAMSGGKRVRYESESIVMCTSKAKDKDKDEITGAIVTAKVEKSRHAVENKKLKFRIRHNGGIDPFYGILDDAMGGGYVIKPKQGFYTRPCVNDDKMWREKQIWDSGSEFWGPIFKETDFKWYLEKSYSFKHNSILSDTVDYSDTEVEEPDDE